MKRLVFTCLMATLASCQFQTSTRIADWGRVHKGIAIKADSLLQDEEHRLYAKGRTGTYKRRGYPLWKWAMEQPSQGRLTQVEDVFESTECLVSLNLWRQMAWEENVSLENKQPAGKLLGDWVGDAVYPMGEDKATAHAWWAYPLAGASFVAVDVPCTAVSLGGYVLLIPVAAVVAGIDELTHDICRQIAPVQTSPVVETTQK